MYWIKCDAMGKNVVLIWQQKNGHLKGEKDFFV
jgi:hypothetical protein